MRLFPTREVANELRAFKGKCNSKSIPDLIVLLTIINMAQLICILFVWMVSAPGMNHLYPSGLDVVIFIFVIVFIVVCMCVFMLWGIFLSSEAQKELNGGKA